MFGLFTRTKREVLCVSKLSPAQRELLKELEAKHRDAPTGELLAYLKARSWKVQEASSQYSSTLRWRETICPTIRDVAPFLRGPPDGCIVCLEDGHGDCARDTLGRPILACVGMLFGSLLEMQYQMVYALRRASLYHRDSQQSLASNCSIIEIQPRPGATATFRFPDKNVKLLMEMQKVHFPSTLSSTTHFCGLPSAVVWAFKLCKPFMDPEAYDNMVLKPDFSHLLRDGHVDADNLLVEWGGKLEFSIADYIKWRAAEEGLEDQMLEEEDEVRRYNPSASSSSSSSASSSSELDLLEASSVVDLKQNAILVGKLWKQGSGSGWANNFKWKEKLFMLLPGALLYFDSVREDDESNKPSKAIALGFGGGVYVTCDDANASSSAAAVSTPAPFTFHLVTPSRNYAFCAATEKDKEDWMEALTIASTSSSSSSVLQ